ncbi:MAG: hypothetical protein AAB296_03395, partial [Candidatus Desantisbacteria bacterium]
MCKFRESKNYFIVVCMKQDASTASTRTFDVAIDADQDVVLKDCNLEELATVTVSSTALIESSDLRAVPRKPEVIIVDTAPYRYAGAPYPSITEEETEDILRIDIVNRGLVSTADSIRFATLTLKWGDTLDGTLTGTEADNIFDGSITVYYDNGDDNYNGGDILLLAIATSTFTSGGTVTINIPSVAQTTIPPMATYTYLVVVKAEPDANSYEPHTFTVSCSEPYSAGQVIVCNTKDNIRIQTLGSDTITTSSPGIVIEHKNANLKGDIIATQTTILSVTPDGIENRIEDGQAKALIGFDLVHIGSSTDPAIEIGYVRVKFTTDGTSLLTNGEANFMFKSWRIYRDDGDGVFDSGDNAAGVESTISLDGNGLGTITCYDNYAYSQVSYAQGTGTFFIVMELTDHASGGQGNQTGTRTFAMSIYDGDIGSSTPSATGFWIQDANTDWYVPVVNPAATTTSNVVKAIPVNPQVTVTDTAPILPTLSYSSISDNECEDILKINVRHVSTDNQAGDIRFGSLTLTITDGTNTLTLTQAQALFGTFSLYKDNGDGVFIVGSETLSGSLTGGAISGTPTIRLTQAGTVTSGSISTYFFAVTMKSDAHTKNPRTFKAIIDTDIDPKVEDKRDNIKLYLVDSGIGSSTLAYAQEVPTAFGSITVIPTSPQWLKDNQQDDLLAVKIQHVGNDTEAILELAQLRVRFTDAAGNLWTTSDVQNVFDNLYIVRDNGNGVYNQVEDTQVIAAVDGQAAALSNGYLTFSFTDKDTMCWIYYASSSTFFVAADLLDTASGRGTRSFRASVNITPSATGGDVRLEDANTDLEVSLGTTANSGTSSTTKAIPIDPSGAVTSTSPVTIKNSGQDDLMKLVVTNNGVNTAGSVTITSLRLKVTNGSGVPLSDADAEAIFEDVYLCYSSDGTYGAGDTVVGTQNTMTGWLNASGYGTISLAGSSSTDCIIPANSSKTYFVVVHQKDTASGAGTRTFAVTIDPDLDL